MDRINVTRSSMPRIDEYMEEIKDIWKTCWLTNSGPKHQLLQQQLEEYLGVKNFSLFANGHLALEAAVQATGLHGEVITTPFTFTSTTQAILHSGLVPVFCDIEPETYTIDPNKIEALITEKTSAIMPVHVYGNICDYRSIDMIAKKHCLKVIYDAAHAFGERVDGLGVGTLGDISMFSFHATKVFHSVEGGGLSFHDGALEQRFTAWRQFGMYDKEDSTEVGTNAKMTEFHAAMGLCNLRHLEEEINKRKRVVQRYIERLAGVQGVKLNLPQKNVVSNFAYFPVVFDPIVFGKDRNEVAEWLKCHGVFSRKYFYPITSQMNCLRGKQVHPTPVAEEISQRVLTLPLFADMTQEMVDKVCDLVLEK